MLTPSLEDYLEEIYRFSMELGYIRITDVADKLDVSLPSVNKAVKLLSDKGYLDYIPYKNISLTDKGAMLGKFLVERNHVLQIFLEVIGSKVDREAEAEAMEHYLSKETVDAMAMVVSFFNKNPGLQDKLHKFQQEFRRSQQRSERQNRK